MSLTYQTITESSIHAIRNLPVEIPPEGVIAGFISAATDSITAPKNLSVLALTEYINILSPPCFIFIFVYACIYTDNVIKY